MDLKDLIGQLSNRIKTLKEQIATEEATKNAFIMPFIQSLGYDVFNPLEVIPEMDCDLIKKKGEKIDYAIIKDGEPIILIECKHWKQDLNLHDNQLQKYFVASKSKFGILTNGIVYRFYTDLEKPNIMDTAPFLEINLEDIKDESIEELKKFHKSYFNVDNILSTASELKYISEIKNAIKSEFTSPSAELVKLLAKKVYSGTFTQKILEQFTELVKVSISNHINDEISKRLNVAMKSTMDTPSTPTQEIIEEPIVENNDKIVTTEEEIEAFYIVKSILRDHIASERISYRDAQTYFAIFIDNNNRKPVCRLYLAKKKVIGLFDENKVESKHILNSIDDIYELKDQLIASIQKYL